MENQVENFFLALRRGNLDIMQSIIDATSYDINAKEADQTHALHVVTDRKNLETLKFLLNQKGIDKNATDHDGKTALMKACDLNFDIELIETMLNFGCDVNLTDSSGLSALHFAIQEANESVVKLLINHGGDVNLFTKLNPETPIIRAIYRKHFDILTVLLYHNVEATSHNLNMSFNNYKYFWNFVNQYESVFYLLLPWFDMRYKNLLAECTLPNLRIIWNSQQQEDKIAFKTWCLESIDNTELAEDVTSVMQSIFKKDFLSDQPGSFIHQLFEEEELFDLMYYPKTCQYFLEALADGSFTRNRNKRFEQVDQFIADYLRIMLCNCNEIVVRMLFYMTLTLLPSATLTVLEDTNVKVIGSINELEWQLDWWKSNANEIIKLWGKRTKEKEDRIYFFDCVHYPRERLDRRRQFEMKKPNYDLVCDEVVGILPKYINTDSNKPCSLIELSRNVIRQSINAKSKWMVAHDVTEVFPFQYANDIKSLPVPKKIHDILLFRLPIYQC